MSDRSQLTAQATDDSYLTTQAPDTVWCRPHRGCRLSRSSLAALSMTCLCMCAWVSVLATREVMRDCVCVCVCVCVCWQVCVHAYIHKHTHIHIQATPIPRFCMPSNVAQGHTSAQKIGAEKVALVACQASEINKEFPPTQTWSLKRDLLSV